MKLNAEISRNLFLRVLGGLPGHCVCSVLVGTGHWLVLSQANGIIASTEGWSPSTRVVWPAPVASSTKRAPPGTKRCTLPPASPISMAPERGIMH